MFFYSNMWTGGLVKKPAGSLRTSSQFACIRTSPEACRSAGQWPGARLSLTKGCPKFHGFYHGETSAFSHFSMAMWFHEKWVWKMGIPICDPICQKWDETAMNSSRGSRIPAKVSWIFTSTCCGYSRCGRIRPAAIVEMAPSKNGKHHVKCIFGWAHIVIQWETMGF